MSISDDLASDLANTFFADFNDTATIDGSQVVGKLDLSAHQWADINSSSKLFTAPTSSIPELSRGMDVVIAGVTYKLVKDWPENDLTRMEIAIG